MAYTEDDMLMLSGIQHFVFCPRQWALIHIEQQWEENTLTAEGNILHQNVDNPEYRQKNGLRLTLRKVAIASKELGLTGFSDAIELIKANTSDNAIHHEKYPGYWHPLPIEYKHGTHKPDKCDEVQVAAQAICLEEQYGIHISEGAIYYESDRKRVLINIDDSLRHLTTNYAKAMHDIYKSCVTPKAEYKPHCKNCSLFNICMPNLSLNSSVEVYLEQNLYEETA